MDYNHNMEDTFVFETTACPSLALPSLDETSAKGAGSWNIEDQFRVNGDLFSELQGLEGLEDSDWVTDTIDLHPFTDEELESFANLGDVLEEMSEASSPLSIISDKSFVEDDNAMFSSQSSPLSESSDISFIEEDTNAMLSPQSDSGVSCTSFDHLLSPPLSPVDVSIDIKVEGVNVDIASEAIKSKSTLLPTVDLSAILRDTGKSLPTCIITSDLITNEKVSKLSSSRTSPYSKSNPNKLKEKTPIQKLKKKAQNRDAALRYRSKKKGELDILFDEAKELEEKNNGLKDQVQGISKEIEYLKRLMLDVIKARLSRTGSPSQ